ncbi:MAG: hypothetical protein U0840_03930 [Gemmataceae bacterium]
MLRLSTLLVLALAPLAYGQLKIEGDLVVKPHRMGILRAANVPEGAALLWDIDQEDKCHVEECGQRLLVVAPPGRLQGQAAAFRQAEGKGLIVETARATLTFESCQPVPPAANPAHPSTWWSQDRPHRRHLPAPLRQLRMHRDHRGPASRRWALGRHHRGPLHRQRRVGG